ncbi:alpha/beta hydrolase [Rhizobium alvei]|uniref:Palmitoyl-protein thioesterase ABHD10, mitochondrial n=1 Tax=Rhizobium alvei TaxID=1132659 RepID=A0ABT8YPI1_9HYPH|nr:alpha/beta hydrolase [Rhizobium alvei]MDO6965531.1 alpha/beta hydrolase [Rhizobium alvei]
MMHIDVGQEPNLRQIAVIESEAPAGDLSLVWLGGYRSDMSGTKAVELEAHAARQGLHCLRFDYSGHGASSGHYTDGTISQWLEEALAVITRFGRKRLILVGSSMGGWIALRLAEILKGTNDRKLAGMVLIAPAPDFTAALIEPNLTDRERQSLADNGYFEEPSEYSNEPNRFTRALIEDGRRNLTMTGLIEPGCPVHILQGMADPDVPFQHALKIMEKIVADDAILTLIRDGDHRLSRPQDIERMLSAVDGIVTHAQSPDTI